MTVPYHFGFLDRIVGVNFGAPQYVIYYIASDYAVVGPTAPGVPVFTWSSTDASGGTNKGITLVEQKSFHFETHQPATNVTWYIVWSPLAPVPTVDTIFFPTPVFGPDPSNTLTYGNQFSHNLLVNHFFENVNHQPEVSPNGLYTSLAAAQVAADYINAHDIAGHTPGTTMGYINSTGGITDPHPGSPIQNLIALASGPYPQNPPFSRTYAVQYLLFQVPDVRTTIHFSVLGPNLGPNNGDFTTTGNGVAYSSMKTPTLKAVGITGLTPGVFSPPLPKGGTDYDIRVVGFHFNQHSYTGVTDGNGNDMTVNVTVDGGGPDNGGFGGG